MNPTLHSNNTILNNSNIIVRIENCASQSQQQDITIDSNNRIYENFQQEKILKNSSDEGNLLDEKKLLDQEHLSDEESLSEQGIFADHLISDDILLSESLINHEAEPSIYHQLEKLEQKILNDEHIQQMDTFLTNNQ